MSLQVIFDDVAAVPPALRALVGVDRYGSLVFQRRSRLDAMRAAAEAAGASLVHLRTGEDRSAMLARLREAEDDRLFLHCPSHLLAVSDTDLTTFLKQIQYAPMGLHIPVEGGHERRGWALLGPSKLQKLMQKQQEGDLAGFYDEAGDALAEVCDRIKLIDVSEERTMLGFLSGHFDARHFNVIEHDEYSVTKRSRDREKLRREYDFYRLVPPAMQMFLVQPFDFTDDGETASYSMERIAIPDMALQWVHGAFQREEFDRFLRHVFHFVQLRSERRADKAETVAVRQACYVEKVTTRLAALRQAPAYPILAPLLDRACGGLDHLEARFMALYGRMRGRFHDGALVAGHGDLCFSNILYSKTNQYLKLIDPRGASREDELYTDRYYDVAKLSHSILGGYDFINHDKFDVSVDAALNLRLSLETTPLSWVRSLFAEHLTRAGFDLELVRLCEASLFISLLPLHIDRPRKVVAFVIAASNILDELSGPKKPQ